MGIVLWDVVPLRRRGVRLRASELEPSRRGVLLLTDRGLDSSFKRHVREAHLWSATAAPQARVSLLYPIFEPCVVRIVDGTLVLAGIEIETIDQRVAEHQQVWRCTPVVDKG